MPENPKIIRLPLQRLETEDGEPLSLVKRGVIIKEISNSLRSASFSLAIADLGHPLAWIPQEKVFDFWKSELKPHIAQTDQFYLEDFPGNYCYVASIWKSNTGRTVILFEKHH